MKIPNPFSPPPAPPAFGAGKVLPEHKSYKLSLNLHRSSLSTDETTSPLSRLFFNWLTPFLSVGFSRPLEKEGEN